jgi:dTDP-4-amino-4,6-dideoxy-D-galactose acyltransferase
MVRKLDWDSSFFGYPVGRLDITQNSLLEPDKFIKETASFKLVYIFSTIALKFEGLFQADTKVTLSKSISDKNKITNDILFCDKYYRGKHDIKQIEELAFESGQYSRFRKDPNFLNNEFERLYRKWINHSLLKINAIETLVLSKSKEIIGLITIEKKNETTSKIGLIAVHPSYQGLGIGKKLIDDTEIYSVNHGFQKLEVITQLENEHAMKFYLKNQFSVKSIIHIYHYWNR